jgi:hypothetical protein
MNYRQRLKNLEERVKPKKCFISPNITGPAIVLSYYFLHFNRVDPGKNPELLQAGRKIVENNLIRSDPDITEGEIEQARQDLIEDLLRIGKRDEAELLKKCRNLLCF